MYVNEDEEELNCILNGEDKDELNVNSPPQPIRIPFSAVRTTVIKTQDVAMVRWQKQRKATEPTVRLVFGSIRYLYYFELRNVIMSLVGIKTSTNN